MNGSPDSEGIRSPVADCTPSPQLLLARARHLAQ